METSAKIVWTCAFCGMQGNEDDNCKKCGAVLISCYTDEQAVNDGALIDLKTIAGSRLLVRAPNGLVVNRCTASVFNAFGKNEAEGTADTERLWKVINASTQREDDGWFKGTYEGQKLWLVPNEAGGMTLMFPEDY